MSPAPPKRLDRTNQTEPGTLGTARGASLRLFCSQRENEKAPPGKDVFECQLEGGGRGVGKEGAEGVPACLLHTPRCTPSILNPICWRKPPGREGEAGQKQIQGQKGTAQTCRLEGQSVPTRDPPFSCKRLHLTSQCDPGRGVGGTGET